MNNIILHSFIEKIATKLTANARRHISINNFAIPEKRKYPIHDINHARAALSMVSRFGTPEEKKRVRNAVYSKYKNLDRENITS
jgi:hypothetical protein